MSRIQIDRSLCSGFGVCAEIASRSIRIGPDGLAEPTGDGADEAAAGDAAAACPMGAITLVGDELDRAA
ncbi:MAG TPA: ferredoxin [Gaiellaceae bacterium]